ncbi:hypothetical protein GEMRC1_005953 [Eukaryota sp. GEM-RC1]
MYCVIVSIALMFLVQQVFGTPLSCSYTCDFPACHDPSYDTLFISETTPELSVCDILGSSDQLSCEPQFRHVIFASPEVILNAPSFTVSNSIVLCHPDSIVSFSYDNDVGIPITLGSSMSDDPFLFLSDVTSSSLILQPSFDSNLISLLLNDPLNVSFPITVQGEVKLLHNLTLSSTFNPSHLILEDDVTIEFTGGSLVLNKGWDLNPHKLTLESTDSFCYFILARSSFHFADSLHTNCVYHFAGSGEIFLTPALTYNFPMNSYPYLIYVEDSASLSLYSDTLSEPVATIQVNTTGFLRLLYAQDHIAYLRTVHLAKGEFCVENQQAVVYNLTLGSEGVLSVSNILTISRVLLLEQNQIPYNLPLVFVDNVEVEIRKSVVVICENNDDCNFHNIVLIVRGELDFQYYPDFSLTIKLRGGTLNCHELCQTFINYDTLKSYLNGHFILEGYTYKLSFSRPTPPHAIDLGGIQPTISVNTSILSYFSINCTSDCSLIFQNQGGSIITSFVFVGWNDVLAKVFIYTNVTFNNQDDLHLDQIVHISGAITAENVVITPLMKWSGGTFGSNMISVNQKLIVEHTVDFNNLIYLYSASLQILSQSIVTFTNDLQFSIDYFTGPMLVSGTAIIPFTSTYNVVVYLDYGKIECNTGCSLSVLDPNGTLGGIVSLRHLFYPTNYNIPLFLKDDTIIKLHLPSWSVFDVVCLGNCIVETGHETSLNMFNFNSLGNNTIARLSVLHHSTVRLHSPLSLSQLYVENSNLNVIYNPLSVNVCTLNGDRINGFVLEIRDALVVIAPTIVSN